MTQLEKFNNLGNFYEYLKTVSSAICANKGGIPLENYVGRFFAADVLEMVVEYGNKIKAPDAATREKLERYKQEFEPMRALVTSSQKPIHEMTLEEFEKVMNI
ncbi:MAG: hypothetical protein FWG18_02125 [Alphaproteobacteria bacterium]|nr:hypothetical protein [Alphaproteobacteria bacterium]